MKNGRAGEVPYLLPLSPAQFRETLRRGHGRAILHARAHGLEGVREQLIEACGTNDVYDSQCESTRTKYLLELIDFDSDIRPYASRVAGLLRDTEDDHLKLQLAELAAGLGMRGSSNAAQALRAQFQRELRVAAEQSAGGATDAWQFMYLVDAAIQLDGTVALIQAAEALGQSPPALRADENASYILSVAAERLGEAGARESLGREADRSSAIHEFLRLEGIGAERKRARTAGRAERKKPAAVSLSAVLRDVEELRGPAHMPGGYGWRGRRLSDADIRLLFERFLVEEREPQLQRLLWTFSQRAMPEISPKLLRLAENANDDLRRAAIGALYHLSDLAIRDVVLRLLQANPQRAIKDSVAGLLRQNYDSRSADLIASNLFTFDAADADTRHGVGWDVLNVAEEQNFNANVNPWVSCLIWCYEHTPCTSCRRSAVNELLERDAAPGWVLDEARFDSNEDTRTLVLQPP